MSDATMKLATCFGNNLFIEGEKYSIEKTTLRLNSKLMWTKFGENICGKM